MIIKKINRLAMIMFMAVLPIAFASCSDDKDEPQTPQQPQVIGMLVTYEAQIDSAMLNYLDVTMEYTEHDGQTASIALEDKQITQSVTFKREKGEMPTDLGLELKIAKKQSPVFDGNAVHIKGKVAWQVYTIFSDSTSIKNVLGSGSPYESRSFAVDKLDEFIVRKNGVIAYQWAHDIKYDENGEVVGLKL